MMPKHRGNQTTDAERMKWEPSNPSESGYRMGRKNKKVDEGLSVSSGPSTGEHVDENIFGLFRLYPQPGQVTSNGVSPALQDAFKANDAVKRDEVDIVAIHGLGGTPRKTWTHEMESCGFKISPLRYFQPLESTLSAMILGLPFPKGPEPFVISQRIFLFCWAWREQLLRYKTSFSHLARLKSWDWSWVVEPPKSSLDMPQYGWYCR